MEEKIYFDNGSTSWPKAPGVQEAVLELLKNGAFNINRGNYAGAYEVESVVLETRDQLVQLFHGTDSRNVIFTPGITYSLNYFEMPVLIKYRYELDDDLSIQPFAGGYLAIGVGGKMKDYGAREVKSSFSDKFFKRFDGGLKIGCGMEYQLIYGELAYDFGLANICHSEFESSHTGCLYLNLGVNF